MTKEYKIVKEDKEIMTKEIYERCRDMGLEDVFKQAIRLNFMSMTNSKFMEIMKVYDEVYDKPLTKSQMNCSTCRLNALKKLGTDYFAYEQEMAKEEMAKRQEKRKAGRPRKIDLEATEGEE